MKKLLSIFLLLSMSVSFAFTVSKKSNNIILNPKNMFAFEGVELGSLEDNSASINNKGEIVWQQDGDEQWRQTGWELRGIDLSAYAALRIELAAGQKIENLEVKLSNPAVADEWTFKFCSDYIAYIFFDGTGHSWGDMKNPDPTEGFEIKICGDVKSYKTTKIKSVELIKKEDLADSSSLKLLENNIGDITNNARLLGKEIIWPKNTTDSYIGWNLSGIDLSEYDRLRVEIESNNAKDLHMVVCDSDRNNWHGFEFSIPNVFEVDLSGAGAFWSQSEDEAFSFDKSKGLIIFLRVSSDTPFKNEQKTVIKSLQLLKGKSEKNENLKVLGKDFGSSNWNGIVYDGGVIEWKYDGKNKSAQTGWDLSDVDLSAYEKIRIELASSDVSVDLRLCQHDLNDSNRRCDLYFQPVKPNVFEASFDGSGFLGKWEEGGYTWDGSSKRVDELQIHVGKLSKKGLKTIVKSVTLIKADDVLQQPDTLVLSGINFGSMRDRCFLDNDFAINWEVVRTGYSCCGWRVEKLEGDILELKVASTDVPLRLRIRETANDNESSWVDDGSHIFRIDLKTKKMESGGKWNASEWNKKSKAFDFSQGGQIILEPLNGVFKEGKKTVVEYIKVN